MSKLRQIAAAAGCSDLMWSEQNRSNFNERNMDQPSAAQGVFVVDRLGLSSDFCWTNIPAPPGADCGRKMGSLVLYV